MRCSTSFFSGWKRIETFKSHSYISQHNITSIKLYSLFNIINVTLVLHQSGKSLQDLVGKATANEGYSNAGKKDFIVQLNAISIRITLFFLSGVHGTSGILKIKADGTFQRHTNLLSLPVRHAPQKDMEGLLHSRHATMLHVRRSIPFAIESRLAARAANRNAGSFFHSCDS